MFWIYLIIILVLITVAWAAWSFAPWVPTWSKDLERISRLAELQPSERFYELGCGDGRVTCYMAQRHSARAVGIEAAPPLYLVAKIRQLISQNKNTSIKLGNLFALDLTDADVIYFFGMPKRIEKLKQKLERELKPGTRVISYTFPIESWDPILVDKPSDKDIPIHLYRI